MKKIIFSAVLMLCLIIFALPTAVCAQQDTENAAEDVTAEEDSVPVYSEEPTRQNSADDAEPPISTVESPTVAETVVSWLGEKSSDIFCILTFAGSLVLAYFYKKGLLPVLSSSLSNMSVMLKDGVCGIESAACSMSDKTEQSMRELGESMMPALQKIKEAADRVEQMAQYLNRADRRLAEADGEREMMRSVLEGQMDLFYGFFMAVNLPQYQKELLGRTYAEMKAKIKGECTSEA